MKIKIFKTKEFRIKIIISILLLTIFSLSFLFSNNIKRFFGLVIDYRENEISFENTTNCDYKVNFLDVGQGNCCIIELPDKKTMIIDGGNDSSGEKIYNFLVDRNISTIDYMIATHADVDHIGGFNFLFDKFEIINIFRPMQIAGFNSQEVSSNGTISTKFEVYNFEDLKTAYKEYGSAKFIESTSYRYGQFIENIYKETYYENGVVKNSNITVFYDGLSINGEGYAFQFFAPLKTQEEVDFSQISNKTNGFMTKVYSKNGSNDSSAIFLLDIESSKFLFSGDASAAIDDSEKPEKYEESDFLQSLTINEKLKLSNIDVYLAAHHGSKNSSSFKFLNLIKPKYVVFSYGDNNYGHPNEEVFERIESVESINADGILETKLCGDITFCDINENLLYCLESSKIKQRMTISYEVLILIIFVFIEILIINIRTLKKFDM